MRLSMIGQYTLDGFSAEIPRLMRRLAANDVHLLTNVTLYCAPRAGGVVKVLRSAGGEPIDHLRYDPSEDVYSPARNSRRGAPFPAYSWLEGAQLSRALFKGPDVGYLKGKWQVTVEELALLLAVSPGRALAMLGPLACPMSDEEALRLAVLLQISAQLSDVLRGRSVANWLRQGATMSAFDGRSPLEQLTSFGIAAIDRMYRALGHYHRFGSGNLEIDDLPKGYDWVADIGPDDWDDQI